MRQEPDTGVIIIIIYHTPSPHLTIRNLITVLVVYKHVILILCITVYINLYM